MEAKYINIHQELIERCKFADAKAQFQIYKLYYKSMYNTSLRIVNNSMEAEDIIQESFFAAFDKINTYDGQVSFGAWLKKIVINKSLDLLKKRKVVLESIDKTVYKIAENEEIENFEEINLTVEKVKKAIQQLADGYRIILSLYLLEGYDHDEISEILNISSSSSRSQLARAKRKLIEIVKQIA